MSHSGTYWLIPKAACFLVSLLAWLSGWLVQGIRGSLAQCTYNCPSVEVASLVIHQRPLTTINVVIQTKPCFGFCHLSTGSSWKPGHVRRGRSAVMLVKPCEKPDLTRSDLSLGLNNCEKVLEKSLTRLFPWTNSPCIFLILFACFYVHSRILCVRRYIFLLLRASSHVLQASVQSSRSFAVVLITRVIVTLLKKSSSGH